MAVPELSEEPQLRLLQRLAYWLIRNGLLLTSSPDTLHFVHRTFQDYLGAHVAVKADDFGLLAELLDLLASQSDKRAHLLAMACLEHATELDPAVRTRVQNLARRLLPPRTAEEAREPALAGPRVLELLPGPEGLSDEEAEAVTATAALVGTDTAVPLLARYTSHPSRRVRGTLMRAWEYFDSSGYAEEVLAHVDSEDFYVPVSSSDALAALPRLGPRSRLTFIGKHPLPDILRVLPPGVRKIGLSENYPLQDLRPLTSLR
nr:hypothetical protein [Streptomyces bauhiniae]